MSGCPQKWLLFLNNMLNLNVSNDEHAVTHHLGFLTLFCAKNKFACTDVYHVASDTVFNYPSKESMIGVDIAINWVARDTFSYPCVCKCMYVHACVCMLASSRR